MGKNGVTTIKSLTPTQIGIVKIVKAAVKTAKEELPEGFDWKEAAQIIKGQKIYALAFYGLRNMKIEVPDWLQEMYIREAVFLMMLSDSAERLMSAFDDAGIEYIPLKGIKTRSLYPDKLMRHMSDIDILIHESDYKEKIKPIMQKLGWEEGVESDHELDWQKGKVMVELHKKIVPSYNKDFYRITGDGWEWFKTHSDFEYIFIHFAKHYRDAGVGIGHMAELELCWDKADMTEVGLSEFMDNMRRTLDCWFGDGIADDKVNVISKFIFDSGEFGTKESHRELQNIKRFGYKETVSRKDVCMYRISVLFPSWTSWKKRNPILEKLPVLLPFFWAWRIIISPFNKEKVDKLTKKVQINEKYYEQMESIGLLPQKYQTRRED